MVINEREREREQQIIHVTTASRVVQENRAIGAAEENSQPIFIVIWAFNFLFKGLRLFL